MRSRQEVGGDGGPNGAVRVGGAAGPSPGARRPRSALGRAVLLGAVLWGASASVPAAPSAAADGLEPHRSPDGKVVACRECPEPNEAWYLWEMGPFFRAGGIYPDTYETDGGECMAKPLGVSVAIEGYVWEPAGEGLVQDCPSGRFAYELNVGLGPDARFDWQVDAEASRGLETARALSFEAAADAATTGACGRGVTLSLTQRLEAAHCHRMRWAAAFLLARLRAKADYVVEKRWRWWIKNANWGNEVLYSGDTWRPCDGAHVEMTRLAPVSVHLTTRDGACPDAECATVTVSESGGWLPAPPATAPEFSPLRVTTVTETPNAPAPADGSAEGDGEAPAPKSEPAPTEPVPEPEPLPEDEAPPCSPYPPPGTDPHPSELPPPDDDPMPEFDAPDATSGAAPSDDAGSDAAGSGGPADCATVAP